MKHTKKNALMNVVIMPENSFTTVDGLNFVSIGTVT
jgi:hypothetical protein